MAKGERRRERMIKSKTLLLSGLCALLIIICIYDVGYYWNPKTMPTARGVRFEPQIFRSSNMIMVNTPYRHKGKTTSDGGFTVLPSPPKKEESTPRWIHIH